jgi:oligopeptide/dipeptide ABC transporter ATP-binding protein
MTSDESELGTGNPTLAKETMLAAVNLTKRFGVHQRILRRGHGEVQAVDSVSMQLGRGETLGLVGESGSGKTTVARMLVGLDKPTAGSIYFDGQNVSSMKAGQRKAMHRNVQMVFQDPYSSFDPLSRLFDSIVEPLKVHVRADTSTRRDRVEEVMGLVGLPMSFLHRFPNQLSGGQLQRAAIARALTTEAKLLVLDEPVSALDVSTQAQVVNLLRDLQQRLGVSYVFVAHDLSVVRHVSDRIAVMYMGRIVEEGPADAVYNSPTHPYTAALLSAIPEPNPIRQRTRKRIILRGDIPSPLSPPSGCRFRTRCPYAMDICSTIVPPAFKTPTGTTTQCHLHTTGPTLAGQSVSALHTD